MLFDKNFLRSFLQIIEILFKVAFFENNTSLLSFQ